MEAQLHRSYEEEQPQHTGEEEHHHEKKSVLKKVKAKAKKIKDSIKHLGHDEHGDGHNQSDDVEGDEEEYEDEEMEDEPEVHGAPIYESSAIRSGVVPRQDIGMAPKSGGDFGHGSLGQRRETEMETGRTSAEQLGLERTEREPGTRSGVLAPKSGGDFEHPSLGERREREMETGRAPAEHGGLERTEREPIVRFGVVAPKSGGDFEHRSLGERMETEMETDRVAAEHGGPERTEREPGAVFGVLSGLQRDPQAPMDEPNPSNYQSKVADPRTSDRVEEAGVPPLVASFGKMTVKDESGESAEQKRSYTGSHDQFSPQEIPTSTQFSPESTPKQFDSRKPEEEMPRDTIAGKGSSYTDKISSAASAIAVKAATAKNAVASKLGYGGGGATEEEGTHTSTIDSGASKSHYSPTEYAHKAAAAVTETLAPIYGKVAGVGSAVVLKVPGISTGDEGITQSSMKENKGRGVVMKEYLSEKLRPGEEDKALSEVISDTLHIQKEKTAMTVGGGGETGGRKPIERVTESEEVARRLGSGEENRREGSDAFISGSESSGNTVVDKIKDAVTSWVMKGGESPTSHQGSPAASSGNVEGSKDELLGNK